MTGEHIMEICEEHHTHPEHTQHARERIPDDARISALAELFKAFGDPTRLRILSALTEGELCVCDIAETLDMTISAISHQLRLLRQVCLVRSRREGKTVYYGLNDAHVEHMLGQGMEHITERKDNNEEGF